MKHNFSISRPSLIKNRTRKQGRLVKASRPLPQLLLVTLLLALALVSAGQTSAQTALTLQQTVPLSWRVITNTSSFSICVGEFQIIELKIMRIGAIGQFISGGAVYGDVGNLNVGELIEGNNTTVEVNGIPPAATAIFTFEAKKPGRTTIVFGAIRTGDEGFYGSQTTARNSDPVNVEVTPCYQAYAGAGILNYTKKDICSLERPFKLAGYTTGSEFGVSSNQKDKTQNYVFSPIDSTHGNFSLIDLMTVPRVGCTIYINGTYRLEFYNQAKTEGNIVMTGGGTMVCDNGTFVEAPNANPQIAFRALPQGVMCSP